MSHDLGLSASEAAVAELNGLASRELQSMQAHVLAQHEEMQNQAQFQKAVSSVQELCFDMCVKDVSASSLSKGEKQCVKQCTASWMKSNSLVFAKFQEKSAAKK